MLLSYRRDIDGLRAIAVLAVVLFHTGIPGFSGGFVGVDIFFVISGYLITSIIINELKAGTFSLRSFYERRIRRIFPAFFSVVAFVFVIGAYLFDQRAFADLGRSIVASTLFSSNILFWRESGYFASPSLQKPLLHTWSLAVEEQFYILFPLLLLLVARFGKARYLFWISTAALFSFAASLYGVVHHPSPTFYLVPTRAWELMIGSLLSLGIFPAPAKKWQQFTGGVVGLILVSVAVFFYTEATPFPGVTALVPVVGAAFVIWSGFGDNTHPVGRLLGTKSLVFTGRISYSLYLWHWPLVSFWKYLTFGLWSVVDSVVIIFVSVVCAVLSWKYIEQPFRGNHPLLPERQRLFVLGVSAMVVAVLTGLTIVRFDGMEWRLSRFYPEIMAVKERANNDPMWQVYEQWEQRTENIAPGEDMPVVGVPGAVPSFALIGDSHARALIPAMEFQAQRHGLAGYMLTKSNTPLLLGVSRRSDGNIDSGFDEAAHNERVMAFIRQHPEIRMVLLVGRWAFYIKGSWSEKGEAAGCSILVDASGYGGGTDANGAVLKSGLAKTIAALLALKRQVVLVTDVPEIGYDVPRVYYTQSRWPELRALDAGITLDAIRPSLTEYNDRQEEANAILEQLAHDQAVLLVRPESMLFDHQRRSLVMSGGELLYNDDDHLSRAGALFVAPVFDSLFTAMGLSAEGNVSRLPNHP